MKRTFALLLCVLLIAVGAFTVSAETTAASTTQEGEGTEIVTEIYYEIVRKDPSPYPQGTALGMLILGGMLILAAVVLLCIFLFAFPRWGLMKNKPIRAGKGEEEKNDTLTDEVPTVQETEEIPLVAEEGEDTQSATTEDPIITELLNTNSSVEEEKVNTVKLEDLF